MGASDSTQSTQTGLVGWLAKPFSEDQDAFHWVLFLGFVIIVAIFWRFVLNMIIEAV
jgi:hypothetical protein